MVIYRPGAVTSVQIRDTAGPVETFSNSGPLQETPPEALPSPGVGLRHYAPKARLLLIEARTGGAQLEELQARLAEAAQGLAGERIGVMLPAELAAPAEAAAVFAWGRWAAPEELARGLYAGLRALDAEGGAVILCPLPPAEGIGAAMRDRLRKASHPARK
jgi:L-threonylcarbamoyladenylate synthase